MDFLSHSFALQNLFYPEDNSFITIYCDYGVNFYFYFFQKRQKRKRTNSFYEYRPFSSKLMDNLSIFSFNIFLIQFLDYLLYKIIIVSGMLTVGILTIMYLVE